MTAADRCVCCGEIIPEGQQVCENCKAESQRKKNVLIFDIPEGYGRFWMRFNETEGLLVFGICGRDINGIIRECRTAPEPEVEFDAT